MRTLRQILCTVDFSPASYVAIEKATFLAQLFQADLHLLHVIDVLPQSFGVMNSSDLASQDLMAQAEERARELMRQAKRDLIPYAVKSKSFVRGGNWDTETLAFIRENQTDLLIVPGGETELEEDLDVLLEKATCPVLVYQQPPHQSEPTKGFRRILLALDAKDEVSGLDQFIINHLTMLDPQVMLLGIISPDKEKREVDALRDQLERQALQLKEQGADSVRFRVVVDRQPAHRIHEVAQEENCDLIMMHTHRNNLQGLREFSPITRGVIQAGGVPVFAQNAPL